MKMLIPITVEVAPYQDIVINTDLADWDGYDDEDCPDPHGPVIRILGTCVHLAAIEVTRHTDERGYHTTLAVDEHLQAIIDASEEIIDSPTTLVEFKGRLYFIYGAPSPL